MLLLSRAPYPANIGTPPQTRREITMTLAYQAPRINDVGHLAAITQASLIGNTSDNALVTVEVGTDILGHPITIDIPGTFAGSSGA